MPNPNPKAGRSFTPHITLMDGPHKELAMTGLVHAGGRNKKK